MTVYNDGTKKNNQKQNICLAFTVDDIENEYRKVQVLALNDFYFDLERMAETKMQKGTI